jgi:hypothetical protein
MTNAVSAPACPNCGRPMSLADGNSEDEQPNIFECRTCKVIYMTDDHVPVTGAAV